MFRTFLCAAIAVLFCPAVGLAEGPISLAHSFEQGDVYRVRKHEDASVEVMLESGTNELSHTADSVRQFRVMSVDANGAATVRVAIENVTMRATTSEGTITYDSNSDEKPTEQFEDVAKTIGQPLAEFVVTKAGEVTNVKSLHESVTDIDANSQSLEHPFVSLPDKPIEVGDQWSETFKVVIKLPEELPYAVKLKRAYTLDSVTAGVAQISWRTLVLTPIKDAVLEGELIQRQFAGTLTCHLADGRLIKRTATASGDVVGFQGNGTRLKSEIARTEAMTIAKATARKSEEKISR